MLFLFEFGRPALRPGKFYSTLGGKKFRRYWCGWFALAIFPGDLYEYGEAVRNGEWRNK